MLRKYLPTLLSFVLGIFLGSSLVCLTQPKGDPISFFGAISGALIAVLGAIYAVEYERTSRQKGYALALLPEVVKAEKAISAFRAYGEDNSGIGPDDVPGLIDNIKNELDALGNMPLDGTLLPGSVTAIRRGMAASERLLESSRGKPGTVWLEQALGANAQEASEAFQRAINALNKGH